MEQETGLCTVAVGSPFDGISLYGMFDDPDDATEWAERHAGDSWWVMSILVPETEAPPVETVQDVTPVPLKKHGVLVIDREKDRTYSPLISDRGEDIGDVPW